MTSVVEIKNLEFRISTKNKHFNGSDFPPSFKKECDGFCIGRILGHMRPEIKPMENGVFVTPCITTKSFYTVLYYTYLSYLQQFRNYTHVTKYIEYITVNYLNSRYHAMSVGKHCFSSFQTPLRTEKNEVDLSDLSLI